MANNATPAALGYRWPAEWEPHAATWVAWPHNRETWPGKFDRIPEVFAELVRTIAHFEPVNILAGGDSVMRQAESFVGDLANVTLHDIPTNDAWTRDHGPTFVVRPQEEQAALIDWQYNAWGAKYPPFDRDNAVPKRIAELLDRQRFASSLVLEGGAIDSNGNGVILATKSCLLNSNRNPGRTRAAVEQQLIDNLAAQKVLWLDGVEIAGDDTDGHVDQIARFVNASTIVAAVEENPADANFAARQQNYRQLRALTGQDGKPFDVVKLPMPQPVYHENQRLPASYANFYILNDAVVVPQFEDTKDGQAIGVVREHFSDRIVIGFPASDLVVGLGAIHCLTLQEPSGGFRID